MTFCRSLLSGGHYTPPMVGVESVVWFLILAAALIVLWFRRPHSVLDIWLMVVLCAWLFDIALSAILNAGRFDLGFYVGRFYGLFAASFVLAVLLINNIALQAQLAHLLACAAPAVAPPKGNVTPSASGCSARWSKSSNDAIITKALDGTITGWNRAAERLFGFSAAEAVGQHIDIIVPPDRRAEVQRHPRSGRPGRSHRTSRNLAACTRTAGKCMCRFRVSPIRSAAGEIVGASKIARDITESKKTQAGAQPGDRGAPAHLRDLAGSHPGHGHQGNVRPGQPEFDDHPGLSARGNDRAQRGRIHSSRRSRQHARGNARGAARPADAQLRDPLRPQGRRRP